MKSKIITGREPLFIKAVKNKNGLWNNAKLGVHDLFPAENLCLDGSMKHLINSCYFCGRIADSPTNFIRTDTGTKWELMQTLGLSEDALDKCEALGLYQNGTLFHAGSVALELVGYGISFREKLWLYQLCPECQPLLDLPFLGEQNQEVDVNTVLLMTGRAIKTGNETHKACYFCGRREGTDSVSLSQRPDKEFDLLQAELTLREVIRAVGKESTHKYFLCPECEILIGLSPRIVMTEDGGNVDGESFFEMLNKYTDIRNAFKDKNFVKKAAKVINSIGAEEFLNQLISNLPQSKKRK